MLSLAELCVIEETGIIPADTTPRKPRRTKTGRIAHVATGRKVGNPRKAAKRLPSVNAILDEWELLSAVDAPTTEDSTRRDELHALILGARRSQNVRDSVDASDYRITESCFPPRHVVAGRADYLARRKRKQLRGVARLGNQNIRVYYSLANWIANEADEEGTDEGILAVCNLRRQSGNGLGLRQPVHATEFRDTIDYPAPATTTLDSRPLPRNPLEETTPIRADTTGRARLLPVRDGSHPIILDQMAHSERAIVKLVAAKRMTPASAVDTLQRNN